MIKMFKKIYYILLVPHYICMLFSSEETRELIMQDIMVMNSRLKISKGIFYYLTFHKSYRNLFYHRFGKISRYLKRIVPEYSYFIIGNSVQIDGGFFVLNHPYSTIINAKRIGSGCTICQLTTLGNKINGRNDLIPSIGKNVTIGANVCIIGDITIGDNVIIGAGSVVTKNIPSYSVCAGNPAKVIKMCETE